jgi:hypothetical protein
MAKSMALVSTTGEMDHLTKDGMSMTKSMVMASSSLKTIRDSRESGSMERGKAEECL